MRINVMTVAFLLSALAITKRTSSIDVRLRFYNLNNKKPRPLVMQRRIAGGRGFCLGKNLIVMFLWKFIFSNNV